MFSIDMTDDSLQKVTRGREGCFSCYRLLVVLLFLFEGVAPSSVWCVILLRHFMGLHRTISRDYLKRMCL